MMWDALQDKAIEGTTLDEEMQPEMQEFAIRAAKEVCDRGVQQRDDAPFLA
jgi:hypothetical protein